MSEAGEFVDAALQFEVSPYSYPFELPDGLIRYGTSVGAIRGTIRDARKKFPGMDHDEIVALCSELWVEPVLERRQAAIVLLQSNVHLLVANDLTRIEGFIRTAGADELVDELLVEVVLPLVAGITAAAHARARVVFERWRGETDPAVKSAGERILRSTTYLFE